MEIKRIQSMVPLVIILSVMWIPDATAIFIRDDQPVADFNALALQPEYQSAGYIGNVGATGSFCSGALVSPTQFLTAAHCMENQAASSNLVVGFDTNFPAILPASNVVDYHINPLFTHGDTVHDQAIIDLASPVVGITPAKILTGSFSPSMLVVMIGYGEQGDGLGQAISGANSRLGAENITMQSNS